jgi:AcrR family transcriptional regulator
MSITDNTVRRRESPARRRVLDAASSLFYAEGIHAVGIDRVIAEAGVAKATFYHHFPSKDALVCAYLEGEDARIRKLMAPAGDTPEDRVLWVFDALGQATCGPGFRGCAFINAAAEYPDPHHPVRRVVAGHRAWFHGVLRDLLAVGDHPDAARTATMLMMLRDGLVVGGGLDGTTEARELIRTAVSRVIG